MANVLDRGLVEPVELDLLLEWPERDVRWRAILSGSLAAHLLLFIAVVRLPTFVRRVEPEHNVIVRTIPLYLPPDVLTQKAPNRQKVSKQIDLEDLLASRASPARPSTPTRSVRRFELPKQAPARELAKSAPQILPEAPKIALNQPPGPLPTGSLNGITPPIAPPPTSSSGPFQNIGQEAPPNPHPKIAPPKPSVQAAINGLAQDANGRRLVISDENASEPLAGSPGSTGLAAAPHAAVELKSDPQGADFKPYLTRILAIVRANWRRVIPESARMGQLRGRTILEFVINRDGSIPKLVTSDPSGSEPLDRAAVAGLSMSNPLPPLPADYKGFQVRLAFSFAYNMPAQ
ncbi:MAG: TonB family protein [Acidobacteriaceae bacterium]|nr:TonB family protein [Acidobacteriaceae bacterium]MBV9767041.1 TonB family protein [Acidobacteriaceae bacterium]